MSYQRSTRVVATALALTFAYTGPAWADVIVLSSGDRIEGEVVNETEQAVSIRRRFRDTNIQYVQNVAREAIAKIERGPLATQPAATGTAPAGNAPASMPAETTDNPLYRQGMIDKWKAGERLGTEGEIADKPLYLRRAIEKWKAGQSLAASGDLTRLLTTTKAAELDALSPECEQRAGMPLAAFAAEVHWRVSTDRVRSSQFRLIGVTPYEVPAIVPRLVKEYDSAVRSEIAARNEGDRKLGLAASQPAATRPAADASATTQEAADPAVALASRLTIANWLDRPNELNITRAQAKAMTERIIFAGSLLNERIRLDPAVRRDRSLQSALIGERIKLIALLRAASHRASANVEAQEDSKQAKRARLTEDQQRRALEQQQRAEQEQQMLLQKALRLAQDQQMLAPGTSAPPPARPPSKPPAGPGK